MCGICGIISPSGPARAVLGEMLKVISHRGPDDEGTFVAGCAGLGSRRLSIIDLPGGRQPMTNEDGTVVVVHNGEIYNHAALRRSLEQRGHTFRTRSDTEVIVHLYEEHGERCVEQLNGMFAIAIWDVRQQKLVLLRDRLGQKPLFYAEAGGAFLFGSEVKAILAVLPEPPEVDFEAVHHYLSLRFIPAPHTMLRQIRKLPAAHTLVWQHGQVRLSRYWDLSFEEKFQRPEAELLEQLQDKLRQAVASHLVSDVPVGAFLSGGMDSSMVVALMAEAGAAPFRTFAIGVHGQKDNELPFARLVADRYQTTHVEQSVDVHLLVDLPKIIWHLDEPSDPIAACQYAAAAVAARETKVVLGGDGGDELFAGFDRYRGMLYLDYYAALPAGVRRGLIAPWLAARSDRFGYKNWVQKLRWTEQVSQHATLANRYAEATCFFRFSHDAKRALFGADLWQCVGHLSSAETISAQYDQARASDPIDRMLYADYMTRLPEHSLMLADRMAMAHGLELRSPYLDHYLVEFLAAFPSRLKIRGRTLKYALRKIARSYLPPAIVRRQKQGFMFPVARWFRDGMYPFLQDQLLNGHFVQTGLFDALAVRRLLDEHRTQRFDHHVRLWMLLNLELWHQIYIQRRAPAVVPGQLPADSVRVSSAG